MFKVTVDVVSLGLCEPYKIYYYIHTYKWKNLTLVQCAIASIAARGTVDNHLCVIDAVVLCFAIFRFKGQSCLVLVVGIGRAV